MFTLNVDKGCVRDGCPWVFDNNLMLFRHWMPGTQLDKVNFSLSPFWIRIRGLPLEFETLEFGLKLGRHFIDLFKVDSPLQFFYHCGLIGHIEKSCKERDDMISNSLLVLGSVFPTNRLP